MTGRKQPMLQPEVDAYAGPGLDPADAPSQPPEHHVSLAQAARLSGDFETAVLHYRQALAQLPWHDELRLDAAAALLGSGRAAEAVRLLQRSEDGRLGGSHLPPVTRGRSELILAMALARLRRADEALLAFDRALGTNGLTGAQEATARRECARLLLNELGDPLGAARRHAPDEHHAQAWTDGARPLELHQDPDAWLAVLVSALYTGQAQVSELCNGFRRFARCHIKGAVAPMPSTISVKTTKPRIGWISGLLCASPVGFMTLGVVEALAGSAELIFFDRGSKADWAHTRFRAVAAAWKDVRSCSAAELAQVLHAHRLDAVVDLSGWMDLDVLRAMDARPAARQFKWVGGQSLTTGLNCFDGFWADARQVPFDSFSLYSEPIRHFAHGYASYTSPPYRDLSHAAASPPLPARPRPNAFAFVSNPAKMAGEYLRRTVERLQPDKLLLVDSRWRHRHARELVASRLGPWMSRVEFIVPPDHAAYLQTLSDLDGAVVDTEPYSMGLTAIELRLLGKSVVASPRSSCATMSERHCVGHLSADRFDRHQQMADQVLSWCMAP